MIRCSSFLYRVLSLHDKYWFHWRVFLVGGSDILSTIFAHIGSQYVDFVLMQLHSPLSVEDVRPNIIDAALMQIWCLCDAYF